MTLQKLFACLMIGLTCSILAACQNTVQGIGKDMQSTGKALQKSVEDK